MDDEYKEIKDKIFTSLFNKHGSSNAWRKYMESVRAFLFGKLSKPELDSSILELLGDEG